MAFFIIFRSNLPEAVLFKYLIIRVLSVLFRLRYRITVKKLEGGKALKKGLFLADYTSELDPFWALILLPRAEVVLAENAVRTPWIASLYRKLGLFKERRKKASAKIVFIREDLKKGWFDPLKGDLAFKVVQEEKGPIHLIKIEGMEGSAFSHPNFSGHFKVGLSLKEIFSFLGKSGLFFLPKRNVQIGLFSSFENLHEKKTSSSLNAYLDLCFTTPFEGEKKVERIPYFRREEDFSSREEKRLEKEVLKKIGDLAQKSYKSLQKQDRLIYDLHLSSLDITELIVFLDEKYQKVIEFDQLQTVGDVLEAASGKLKPSNAVTISTEAWEKDPHREELVFPQEETLLEAFFQSLDKREKSVAAADLSTYQSYARIKSLILGLALSLQDIKGDKVGVLLPASSTFVVTYIALLLLKKTPVILNWTLGASFLVDMVDSSHCEVILSLENLYKNLPFPLDNSLLKKMKFLEEVQKNLSIKDRKKALELSRKKWKEIAAFFSFQQKGTDPVVLLFTSASEGRAKGFTLHSNNLLSNQIVAMERAQLKKEDVMMGLLPPFHVFGFSITHLLPFLFGLRVVFSANPLDLTLNLILMERWKVTVLCTSPTLLVALLSVADPQKLAHVRLAIIGSEKPQEKLFELAKKFPNLQIIEGYGLSECSPVVTLNDPTKEKKGVGTPLSNVALKIVEAETHQEVPKGQEGEIWVAGPNVFAGYEHIKNSSLEKGKEKTWFKTKDRGRLDEEGNLFLTGRSSRFIKKGGELISLDKLEEALYACFEQQYPDIEFAVVEEEEEKVQLFVACNHALSRDEINQRLSQKGFSPLFFVEKLETFSELPRLATGKMNYPAIKKMLRS